MTEKTTKILSKSATDVVKALNLMKQMSSNVEAMAEEVSNLDWQIAEKEDRLQKLSVEQAEAERTALVELDLKVKEGMKNHVGQFLGTLGQVAIDKDRFNTLLEIEQNFENKLESEKNSITKTIRDEYSNQLNLKIAQINAERADDKAALKNLEARLADAQSNANMWKTQLEDERKASVERAKANAIGTVSISGNGK